jgi:hypothetical protein
MPGPNTQTPELKSPVRVIVVVGGAAHIEPQTNRHSVTTRKEREEKWADRGSCIATAAMTAKIA